MSYLSARVWWWLFGLSMTQQDYQKTSANPSLADEISYASFGFIGGYIAGLVGIVSQSLKRRQADHGR